MNKQILRAMAILQAHDYPGLARHLEERIDQLTQAKALLREARDLGMFEDQPAFLADVEDLLDPRCIHCDIERDELVLSDRDRDQLLADLGLSNKDDAQEHGPEWYSGVSMAISSVVGPLYEEIDTYRKALEEIRDMAKEKMAAPVRYRPTTEYRMWKGLRNIAARALEQTND